MNTISSKEGNKLIAEFDGYTIEGDWVNLKGLNPYKGQFHVDNLKYHEDWNSLMPVVDKIESMGHYSVIEKLHSGEHRVFFTTINYGSVANGSRHLYKITAVWQSVIDFIQWHNQQTTTPNL